MSRIYVKGSYVDLLDCTTMGSPELTADEHMHQAYRMAAFRNPVRYLTRNTAYKTGSV